MRLITREEIKNIRVFELDNDVYNSIEARFVKAMGEKYAKRFMDRHLECKLGDFLNQNVINLEGCFEVI